MIYFIRVAGAAFTKIGRAVDVKSRLSNLQNAHYQQLELLVTVESQVYPRCLGKLNSDLEIGRIDRLKVVLRGAFNRVRDNKMAAIF